MMIQTLRLTVLSSVLLSAAVMAADKPNVMILATGGVQSLSRYADMGLGQILAQAWPALLVSSVVNAFLSALQLAVLYAPFSAAWQGIRSSRAQ